MLPARALLLLTLASATACNPPDWVRANGGATVQFDAVHGSGPNDVWAVGDVGTIAHFDGSNWSVVAALTSVHLRAVAASSQTDAWAFGDNGTALHWDGKQWLRFDLGLTTNLVAARAFAANDVWVLPKDTHTLLHYDGVRFTTVDATTRDGYGYCLGGNGPTNLWLLPGSTRYAYRVTATGLVELPLDISGDFSCVAIAGQSADDLWLLADDSVLHYDGRLFRPSAPKKTDIFASSFNFRGIFSPSKNLAWVVGNGGNIWRVEGETWTESVAGTYSASTLLSIWGARTDDLWAVGDKGAVFRHSAPTVDP